MLSHAARIDSTEIIQRFRNDLVKFAGECQRALDGIRFDVTHTEEWLKTEQRRHWTHEIRRREERVRQAREAYQRARFGGSSRCIDEKKALEKARQQKEEAEEKARRVKKWEGEIGRQSGLLMAPCVRLATDLSHLVPKALAKLDRMMDNLDAYFRDTLPGGSAGP